MLFLQSAKRIFKIKIKIYKLWFKLTNGPGNKHIMGFDIVFVLVLREVSFVFALPIQKNTPTLFTTGNFGRNWSLLGAKRQPILFK